MIRYFLFFLLGLLLTAWAASASLADPAPLRHYTFGAGPNAASIRSDTGAEGALTFDPGPGGQNLQIVPGREPGKNAVRLDQGSLAGAPFPIAGAFTVEMWCRSSGLGAMRGNSGASNGTLMAAGSGYWDGWRLTATYPEATVNFEIGRPQPSSSVGIGGGALATGVWQHVAASWDGQTMRLFVNGLPMARGPYSGAYTPPPSGLMRIGYADSGVGSLRLDVDEVAAYGQALDPVVILESANAPTALPARFRQPFRQALEARERDDFAAAATAFRSLRQQATLPASYRATARLGLAEALQSQGRPAQAGAEYAALTEGAGVPEGPRGAAAAALLNLLARGAAGDLPPRTFERLLAQPGLLPAQRVGLLFDYAQALRRTHAYPAALAQYDQVLALPDLSSHDRWNAALERVYTLCESDDLSAAHASARGLAHTLETPGYYGSLALLSVARRAVQEQRYSQARDFYREVIALTTAPVHHQEEARLGLREIARREAGLAAYDPAWSRVSLPPEPKPGLQLFVAPNGSNASPGTRERPYLTLAHARDAIRTLRRVRGALPGGVTVVLRGGEYPVRESFALTANDSGTASSPIVYAAAPGETPVLTGAARLRGFGPVKDPDVLARLPQEARSHVLQADLRASGVTDFGRMQPHGYGQNAAPTVELFYEGRPMTLARWPKTGFLRTGKVVDAGAEGPNGRGMEFEYDGDRPARWANDPDIWLYGYWYWDWADGSVKVASVDPATHRIRTATTPPMGIRSGQRFYAFNVPEELSAPGEWYLDRARGLLLFYPPGQIQGADVRLSVLDTPLATLDGVSHVTLRGLTLEGGRGAGVTIKGGDHCLLAACTIRRLGGDAVTIDGGTGHGVLGCDLYTLGRGGVHMAGGDRKTLTPGRHFVENCDIHDFSRLDRTYTPAVWVDGVGNRIAHNHLHDAPHHAIRLEGNDHIVEFNEVDHVVTEADDQGGLDMWFNPSYRGNILRDNFWHDIGGGPDAVGHAGIRLDDAISGTLVYQNVFLRCAGGNFGGVQINGGKENWIDNNLFLDCKTAISFSFWGTDRWKEFLAGPQVVEALTKTVDIHRPPYSVRYPALADLESNVGVNSVWRNLVVNCPQFLSNGGGRQDLAGNTLTADDFALRSGARLPEQTGFDPIPFAEIGRYPSADRAPKPVR